MVCSNEYSKIFEFTFDECHYFGDLNSIGLIREKDVDEDMYLCYEYILYKHYSFLEFMDFMNKENLFRFYT